MPAGDRTGPESMGPRSGRGAGYCTGFGMPGYENSEFARGYQHGRMAARRRFRRWQGTPMHMGWTGQGNFPNAYSPPAPMTEEQEQEALKAEESWLQEQLEAVRSRMKKEE